MAHSLKNRIIAAFLGVLAVTVVLAALVGYQYVRSSEHSLTDGMGLASAQACAYTLDAIGADRTIFKPDAEEYEKNRDILRSLCKANGMSYLYACDYDLDKQEVTYIFCVAADDEEDAIVARERPYGTVRPAEITEVEKRALAGEPVREAVEFDNEFGHMLDWFSPVSGYGGNVLAGASYSVLDQRKRVLMDSIFIIVPFVATLLVLLAAELFILRKHVFRPLHVIAERMRGFSAENAGEFEPLGVETHDEIGEIADAFEGMVSDIDTYVTDIERMTAERVQADIEMDVARRIQLGMVPEHASLKGPSFDAYAFARTAREVGGDFYECMMVDGGRMAAIVGDVSGKGVAAALFMGMTKAMIHDRLAVGDSPAAALNQVNERLCQTNPEGMFVTVFALVYNMASGEVVFANAGHMPPLLVGEDVRALDADPGVLLGLFEDVGLQDGIVHLSEGESLLLYTDGATEAVNPSGEFLGEGAFRKLIGASAPYAGARELVDAAARAIDGFSGGHEQFDDLTLVALMRHSGASRSSIRAEWE